MTTKQFWMVIQGCPGALFQVVHAEGYSDGHWYAEEAEAREVCATLNAAGCK